MSPVRDPRAAASWRDCRRRCGRGRAPHGSSARDRRCPGRSGRDRGRRRSRSPARPGSRPGAPRSRSRRPRPRTSAPAGRTGAWWRSSRRRSRQARRGAVRAAPPSRRRCPSADAGPPRCPPRSMGRRKPLPPAVIWWRTRSRSSWLAARPKVMSSIWSSVACALRDVAGHQARQRERLAGARAGLQHRGRACGGQRTDEVEPIHQSGLRSARSIGSQSLPA